MSEWSIAKRPLCQSKGKHAALWNAIVALKEHEAVAIPESAFSRSLHSALVHRGYASGLRVRYSRESGVVCIWTEQPKTRQKGGQ